MGLAQKTIKNSIFNVGGWAWTILLNLAATPYIVHHLGTDAYGILAIISSLMGYFGLLDLGLGQGVLKYTAEYYVKGDYGNISKVIGSALLIYLIIGLVGFGILLYLSSILPVRIIKMSENMKRTAVCAFQLASAGFFLSMVTNVYLAVPKALQRYDLVNKVNVLFGTLTTLLTILILYLGFWLKEILLLKLMIGLSLLITYSALFRRLLPAIDFSLKFDREIALKLFKFGGYTIFSRFSGIATREIDKLMIGVVLGTTSLAFYAVPQKLVLRIKEGIFRLVEVLMPLSSELSSSNQIDKLKSLYLRSAKLSLSLNLALFIPIVMFSHKILYFWIGKDFADRGWIPMVILACAAFSISVAGVPSVVNSGCGRPGVNAFFSALTAVINIGVIYPLIKYFGIAGAAIALLTASLQVPFAIFYTNRNVVEVNNILFLKTVFPKAILAAGVQIFLTKAIYINFCKNIWCLILMIALSTLSFLVSIAILDKKEFLFLFRMFHHRFYKKYESK